MQSPANDANETNDEASCSDERQRVVPRPSTRWRLSLRWDISAATVLF